MKIEKLDVAFKIDDMFADRRQPGLAEFKYIKKKNNRSQERAGGPSANGTYGGRAVQRNMQRIKNLNKYE